MLCFSFVMFDTCIDFCLPCTSLLVCCYYLNFACLILMVGGFGILVYLMMFLCICCCIAVVDFWFGVKDTVLMVVRFVV